MIFMPRNSKATRRLEDLGLESNKSAARPDDEGLGNRERRGLQKENQKAYGHSLAGHAIHDRVKGDLAGRKDT